MKTSKKLIAMAAFAAMATATATASAATTNFTYNVKGEQPDNFGYELKQTYDVAIHIADQSLVGAKVMGFSVAVPEAGASAWSGWLSTELKLEKKKNVPNVCSVAATPADGMLNITFAEPYTITAEGVYVGYTLTVDEIVSYETENPVSVVPGNNPEGLYIHASRSQLKWTSKVESLGAVSAMNVTLEGDFQQYAASAALQPVVYSAVGEKGTFNATLSNHGSEPISSIEYSYAISNGTKGSGSVSFEEPIDAVWGAQTTIAVTVNAVDALGDYDIDLTVDRINGNDNKDAAPTCRSVLKVIPFVPVNRPLVEEYTGLWCGYCPVGYIALETLKEDFGSQFVALSYHNGDPMATIADNDYPQSVDGFPSSFINRYKSDVYPGDLVEVWPEFAQGIAIADIDVKLDWADEAKTQLAATAACRFVEDQNNADYTVAFFLVGDNMTDPDWQQSNYLSGETSLTGKYAELFIEGGDKVSGLVFNDIVLSGECSLGTAQGLPANIKQGETVEDSYTFDLTAVKNLDGADIITDKTKIRVVAAILDRATGEAINSNSSDYASSSTGIANVTVEATSVIATEYYDLTGRRISSPAKGVSICVRRLDNGQSRTRKVIR